MPLLYKTTLRSWYKKHDKKPAAKKLYLFCDEFTNFNDVEIGIKAILLLERLGYDVIIPDHEESGRTWLSKGLLRKAKTIANENITLLAPLISEETPLIGLEPSAILSFRDEYVFALANLESLIGQLYPAIVLARLVSLPAEDARPEEETDSRENSDAG